MNILGVGGTEFLIILIIMLIVAGPKRMIHWSGILGQYVAKFRRMWAETVDIVQQEFDEAGVGIQLPRDVPTRGSLNKQASKMLSGVSNPIKETMDQVNAEIGEIKEETTATTKTATSQWCAARTATSSKRSSPNTRRAASLLRPRRQQRMDSTMTLLAPGQATMQSPILAPGQVMVRMMRSKLCRL